MLPQPYINWSYSPVDPLQSRQNIYTVPLPFAGPIDQVSNKICIEFASTNASLDSQLRCATLLRQSIRSLRMNYVNYARLRVPRLQIYDVYDQGTDFQQDGYVFMMTYVYDDDSMMNHTKFSHSNPDWNDEIMHDTNATTAQAVPNCPARTTEIQHQSGNDQDDNVERIVPAHAAISTLPPSPAGRLIRPHVCIFGEFSSHLATLMFLMRYHVHWIFPSTEEEEEFELGALHHLTDRWMNEIGVQFTFASVTGKLSSSCHTHLSPHSLVLQHTL